MNLLYRFLLTVDRLPVGKFGRLYHRLKAVLKYPVFIGIDLRKAPAGSVIFFPLRLCRLSCGLTGIVTFKHLPPGSVKDDPKETLSDGFRMVREKGLQKILQGEIEPGSYLDSKNLLNGLEQAVVQLKKDDVLFSVFVRKDHEKMLRDLCDAMKSFLLHEENLLEKRADHFSTEDLETINSRLLLMKDGCWSLEKDILDNLLKIEDLCGSRKISSGGFRIYTQINYLLNCLDRIEVRGRDSAGIQMILSLDNRNQFAGMLASFRSMRLYGDLLRRSCAGDLVNGSIRISFGDGPDRKIFLTFTYKTASVIGELGRNVRELRQIIRSDRILHEFARGGTDHVQSMAHTRWASVGSITEENCHPVNNFTLPVATETVPIPPDGMCGIPPCTEHDDLMAVSGTRKCYPRYGEGNWSINVILNGDIDNYPSLRNEIETGEQTLIAPALTTDTKIIPLEIERHLLAGQDLTEAFRLAVSNFEGSHAIAMTSDLEPGKAFLALKGSGQSVYVGFCEDKFIYSSELYGIVEGTSRFIKMEGEGYPGKESQSGQIFILRDEPGGGIRGMEALHYNGTPLILSENDPKLAEITTRDIDRGSFPHYFLKEISESSVSVRKTLRGKYRISRSGKVTFNLGEDILPARLRDALASGKIRHITLIGHGTAAVAGTAICQGFSRYLAGKSVTVEAKKASELSGFALSDDLHDTLVIPITQSGTTTDTNRAVSMAAERGAFVVAIVNRRQSDITHKAHGVFYTSDGRDIEMSVASTKAFYSQIVAGHVLALFMAQVLGNMSDRMISSELQSLEKIPGLMDRVMDKAQDIQESARKLARVKNYWAVVGSGPNKAAADEIRIKLSELCYKTISSDIVEDKKHIDLSAEPLIIVCAAGNPETVLGDIVKDVSIFKAHKAAVVVFADEGEDRFREIADSVITLPAASMPIPVILNTMAGHLWGYHAACSIDEDSSFFQEFRNRLNLEMTAQDRQNYSLYEKMADKNLHLVLDRFYVRFHELRNSGVLSLMSAKTVSDIALLGKYAAGKLPLEDFWSEFNGENSSNPIDLLNISLGHAVDELARPIDAIRHQAKTVTVGTSRKEEFHGPIFDLLSNLRFSVRSLKGQNIPVLNRIQRAISQIRGYTLYDVNNLDEEGVPLDTSTITIRERGGIALQMNSRVEVSGRLMGTKKTIARTGSVYVGFGRSDGAPIALIPLLGGLPGVRSLLLAHVEFNESLSAAEKVSILGYRYADVKNLINEYNLPWDDRYLDRLPVGVLLGESVEFIATKIRKSLEEK